jgi:FlaA1/EpsC-like NDP-sugar epimerase
MNLRLTGKRVLITAGTGGIGRDGIASACVGGCQGIALLIENPLAT